ncbi:MAG: TonB-dependent receptor [Paludibacteraceae bacterium]|nr:TonB-dependent receptor [Paludibacteraceae bacterium]
MRTNLFFRRRRLRFKRLSRKGYAAFCSMHREVTIGRVRGAVANLELLKAGKAAVLAILLMTPASLAFASDQGGCADSADETEAVGVSVATADTAQSQSSVHRQFSVQEVLVVADKAELQSNTYRLVSTVSRNEIAALPVTTVADIFQYLPGLDLRKRGANGAQCDLSMRGGTFDQVQVLLNGIPVNDAQTGHYSLHLPVSPMLIERIEVLQDGVNIVTTAPQPVAVSRLPLALKLAAGMNGFCQPSAAGSWQSGEWQVNASAEYSRSDGYYAPAPSDKEREALVNNGCRWANIYLQTRWRGLDVQVGAQYKDAGAGLFYGGSTDQSDATRTAFGSARYKHHWGAWSLETKAAYRANYDHYEWHRGQPAGSNTHLLQTAAAGLQGAYISWLGTTTAGIELRNENIRSTNLGDTNRVNLTYFARQTFHYDRLNASLGVSGIYNTYFGNHYTCGANIGYEYLPGSSVYLNALRGVRMPTFTDLNYDAGNQLGSKDLKPEKMWTFSLGGTYDYKGLSLTADAWYRRGTDIIDWVYVPTDTRRPYHAMNQQRINSAGTELTAVYRPSAVSHRLLAEWLRQVKVSYAYTWLDLDLHEVQSRYLDYLSHKLVFGIEHGIWVSREPKKTGVLAASWTLRWQKREGDYTSAEGIVTSYKPVLLLDGSVYWQNERVKISAECTNMTNRHYYDYGSLLMPGAWGTMAIEVRL